MVIIRAITLVIVTVVTENGCQIDQTKTNGHVGSDVKHKKNLFFHFSSQQPFRLTRADPEGVGWESDPPCMTRHPMENQ